jgi:hypothetical protein
MTDIDRADLADGLDEFQQNEVLEALEIKKRLEEYMRNTKYLEFRHNYGIMMDLKKVLNGEKK